jgi:hypothetical protein
VCDHVHHVHVQVAAHPVDELADLVDVVGVWPGERQLVVTDSGGEVAGRPDEVVRIAGAVQHVLEVEQVPLGHVRRGLIAVDE